jgi:hypothetical protein
MRPSSASGTSPGRECRGVSRNRNSACLCDHLETRACGRVHSVNAWCQTRLLSWGLLPCMRVCASCLLVRMARALCIFASPPVRPSFYLYELSRLPCVPAGEVQGWRCRMRCSPAACLPLPCTTSTSRVRLGVTLQVVARRAQWGGTPPVMPLHCCPVIRGLCSAAEH